MRTFGAIVGAGFRAPACWLALVGLLVVGAVISLPPLASFADAWYIPALITLAAWLAMASTQVEPEAYRQLRYRLAGHDPYLIRALERRDALAAEIGHLAVESVRADVAGMLRRLDRELLPELAARARRHRALLRALGQLEHGQGPLVGASPENLAALRRLAGEQEQALDGFLTRLSDMNANLMGLTQESDQRALVEQSREWAEELGAYWQAVAEVFRPDDLAATGRDRGTGRQRGARTPLK